MLNIGDRVYWRHIKKRGTKVIFERKQGVLEKTEGSVGFIPFRPDRYMKVPLDVLRKDRKNE